MPSTTVKRSQFKTFLNTGTTQTPIWSLIGDGVTSAVIQYNPQTTEEVYIHQDSGSVEIDAYKPTMPIEAKALNGDAVFEFVDALRKARAVGSAAYAEVVNVWLYETPTTGAYPAEKQSVSIQVEDFGGEGGQPAKINFTINFRGDPTAGTFNPTTLAFTAS
ncbi:MAG: phage tail tube protein [Chloroflexota bacterium]